MALEEKRALDEILVRVNSKTAPGSADGVALTYRTWVEKDGLEMPGTSRLESPAPADWESSEVVSRIGELPAQLQSKVDALQARVLELEKILSALEEPTA